MELNNPLRKTMRPLPPQDLAPPPIATSVVREEKAVAQTAFVPAPAAPKELKSKLENPLPSQDPALKAALALLARNGIEIAAPKKSYVKHSYEIEEDLHKEFHEMYSVLGFKQVKAAMNDALRLWCKTNQAEYLRRKG